MRVSIKYVYLILLTILFVLVSRVILKNTLLLWLSMTLLTIITILSVILSTNRKQLTTNFILHFIFMSSILLILKPEIYHLSSTDDYFEYEYTRTIIDNGHWIPEAGVGRAKNYYGYMPALHIVMATLTLILNAPTILIVKYVIPFLIRLLLSIFIYHIVMSINLSKEECKIALVLYPITYMFSYIHCGRLYFATIFVFALVYLIFKLKEQTISIQSRHTLLIIILIIATVISNHLATFVGLVLLLPLVYFSNRGILKRVLILYSCVGLAWYLYLSAGVLAHDTLYLQRAYNIIVSLARGTVKEVQQYSASVSPVNYSIPEIASMAIGSIIGYIVLPLTMLVIIIKKLITSRTLAVKELLMVYGLLYSVSLLLLPISFWLSHITLWFAVVGYIVGSAYTIVEILGYISNRRKLKIIMLVAIITIMFISNIQMAQSSRIINDYFTHKRLVLNDIPLIDRTALYVTDFIVAYNDKSNIDIVTTPHNYYVLALEHLDSKPWLQEISSGKLDWDDIVRSQCCVIVIYSSIDIDRIDRYSNLLSREFVTDLISQGFVLYSNGHEHIVYAQW